MRISHFTPLASAAGAASRHRGRRAGGISCAKSARAASRRLPSCTRESGAFYVGAWCRATDKRAVWQRPRRRCQRPRLPWRQAGGDWRRNAREVHYFYPAAHCLLQTRPLILLHAVPSWAGAFLRRHRALPCLSSQAAAGGAATTCTACKHLTISRLPACCRTASGWLAGAPSGRRRYPQATAAASFWRHGEMASFSLL